MKQKPQNSFLYCFFSKAIALSVVILLCQTKVLSGQDSLSVSEKIAAFPQNFFDKVNHKMSKLECNITANTEKTLKRLAKQEARLQRKMKGKDSLSAMILYPEVQEKYREFQSNLKVKRIGKVNFKTYNPYLDSLRTSLRFLNQVANLKDNSAVRINETASKLIDLEARMEQVEEIRRFLKERRNVLKDQLNKLGLAKKLKQYNKETYYYSQQIREYQELLKDPSRVEKKALSLLGKLPVFQTFMRRNSELAALFPMPDNYVSSGSPLGLQSRVNVQQLMRNQTGLTKIDGQQLLQQNIQPAKSAFEKLKDKIDSLIGSSNNEEILDFKPNSQKTKSFWRRLEFGTNLQTVRANAFFPSTTDIGLSLGYKLNDQALIGIGGSYKIGWEKHASRITITHEGLGVRSFIDWKLKGSFFISGAYEQNYRHRFEGIMALKSPSRWQQSGLIGFSKIVSLKTKVFKKTKVQLLWDFTSHQQIPSEQPIRFRIGYSF